MSGRKTARTTPIMRDGLMTYREETPIGTFFHTVALNSKDFNKWLSRRDARCFAFDAYGVIFTCHHECRGHWSASKRIGGKVIRRYLGQPDRISSDVLCKVAQFYADRLKSF